MMNTFKAHLHNDNLQKTQWVGGWLGILTRIRCYETKNASALLSLLVN